MIDKALLVDFEYCTGCRACELACRNEHDIPDGMWGVKVTEEGPWRLPSGGWHWDYVPVPTEICDFCADRVAKGSEPSCVQHCPAKVIECGSTDELLKKIVGKGKKMALFVP
jgi:Fe-S-cluster-containing dehydrogenase component